MTAIVDKLKVDDNSYYHIFVILQSIYYFDSIVNILNVTPLRLRPYIFPKTGDYFLS